MSTLARIAPALVLAGGLAFGTPALAQHGGWGGGHGGFGGGWHGGGFGGWHGGGFGRGFGGFNHFGHFGGFNRFGHFDHDFDHSRNFAFFGFGFAPGFWAGGWGWPYYAAYPYPYYAAYPYPCYTYPYYPYYPYCY